MGNTWVMEQQQTLIHQSIYDALEEEEKEGKYSSESIESYFTTITNFC